MEGWREGVGRERQRGRQIVTVEKAGGKESRERSRKVGKNREKR